MTADMRVNASWIGPIVRGDPGFSVPERPFLPPAIAMTPFGTDGILFEGSKNTQIVRGRSARSFLAQLLPLLDGTRTLPELAREMPGYPLSAVQDAVALLYSRGLLHDGFPRHRGLSGAFAGFVDRYLDVTRANRNESDVEDRLKRATIGIHGPDAFREALQAELLASGFVHVETCSLENLADYALLISCVEEARDGASGVLEAARRAKTMHMIVSATDRGVQLGPLVSPDTTGCYRCYELQNPSRPATLDSRALRRLIPLLSHAVLEMVTRLASPVDAGDFVRFTFDGPRVTTERSIFVQLPWCSACGSGQEQSDPDALIPLLYHHAVSMPPQEMMNDRAYQHHFYAPNVQLATTPKVHLAAIARLPLPPPVGDLGAPPWASIRTAGGGPVSLADLSTLLWFTAGKPGKWRMLPSGGGLESQELYIISTKGVDGIPPGVYRYEDAAHELHLISRPPERLVQGALGSSNGCPALAIIGTALLSKIYAKYRNLAYKIVHLDGGVALGMLLDVAETLSIRPWLYLDYSDDVLAEILSFPQGAGNVVTFALGLGAQPPLRFQNPASSPETLVDAMARLTATPFNGHRARTLGPSRSTPWGIERDFADIIRKRESTRQFQNLPVSRATAAAFMHAANARRSTLSELGGNNVVPLLASSIDLEPGGAGVYMPTGESELTQLRPHFSSEMLRGCFQQRDLAEAPMGVFIIGDVARQLSLRGPRGYRELAVAAGAVALRVVLAATAHGLGACFSGGYFRAGVTRNVSSSEVPGIPFFSIALGQKVEQTTEVHDFV
jgi:SagB-type dehydrogenase family enzyme